MICSKCGGKMIGDGLNEVIRCENTSLNDGCEPDVDPIECKFLDNNELCSECSIGCDDCPHQKINQFKKFLINNGIYDKFKTNYINACNELSFTDFLLTTDKALYVITAFIWSRTPEGFHYWKYIDAKWR